MKRLTVILSVITALGLAATSSAQSVEAPTPSMETPDDKVYNKTETRPGYRAGKQEMARHINETLIYPALAKEIGRQGVVHISFVIELDGSISNPAVTRGVQWQMNAEALRVVKTLGAFNPGTIGGAPVRTRVTLPIRFVLQE